MKNRLAVVTTTRAEYGVLFNTLKLLFKEEFFDVKLIVSGTHLSQNFGNTITEIEQAGMPVATKIDIMSQTNSCTDIFANAIVEFSKCFSALKPNAVMVVGDRFEILAVAAVCLLMGIPIVHISGGDTTFGAIDDACRHSITKMASLHFTGNEQMRKRVIQLGENPSMVFNVGEPGLENMLVRQKVDLNKIGGFEDFLLQENEYALVTYHPVTTESGDEMRQIINLTKALDNYPNIKFIITKANCDKGGNEINAYLEEYAKNKSNIKFISSLGVQRYFALLSTAAAVIGNSSSGIVEAPFWHVPTVNVGNRQEGRMQGETIINCNNETDNIIKAIDKALTNKFRESCNKAISLYGDGHVSDKIVDILHDFMEEDKLTIKKHFFDVEFKI